jgi:hypothetical protein
MTAVGLRMSREEAAADVAAYVVELHAAEAELAAASDDEARERASSRVEAVREQLRLRGQAGESPVKRASRRTRDVAADVEVR